MAQVLRVPIVSDHRAVGQAVKGAEAELGKLPGIAGKANRAFADAAKKGFAAAGVAAGAAMSVGLAQTLEADSARARLSAQLGVTAAESERLGKVAGSLYANAYGESLGEVNQAVRGVIQNIGSMASASSGDIEKVTGRVMSLAQAFDQDLGQTTRAIDQMIRTGLAPNAQAALDILARGFQTGADEAGDLLDTFSEYSTQFRKVGLDGQHAMGLISQGLQAGARDADIVADAFKEFSIRAIDGLDTTKAGFDAVGLSAKDMAAKIAAGGPEAAKALDLTLDRLRAMEDPVKRDAAAVALFGTQAEDLGAALLSLDLSSAVAALGEVEGAARKLDETLGDTAENKIAAHKRAFEQWAATLITSKGPVGELATSVAAFGQSALGVLGPIGSMIAAQRAASVASSIAAGQNAAAAATTSGSWIAASARTVAAWAVMGAQSLIHAAKVAAAWVIAMGPIGWATVAVAGLAVLVIANWDRIKRATVETWRAVSGAVASGWREVTAWFGRFVDAGRSLVDGIVRGIGSAGNAIRDRLLAMARAAWDAVRRFFRIGSPSRLMETSIGVQLPAGVAKGILAGIPTVVASAEKLAAAAHGAAMGTLETGGSATQAGTLTQLTAAAAYAQGSNIATSGRGGGPATVNVTVNVAGTVAAERDLVDAVRRGLVRAGQRNVSALGGVA